MYSVFKINSAMGFFRKDVTEFSSAPQLDGTRFISLFDILSSWLKDCKPAASPFLNFPDPKWEVRFFDLTCNTKWWYGSLLCKAANSSSFRQEVRHQLYLREGFYHILYPPYFILAWQVEDGDHWGQGSPTLCLLGPDLCSPLIWATSLL